MNADDSVPVAASRIDACRDELLDLSRRVHGFRELAFEERRSVRAVAAVLERHGFTVDIGGYGLDTALEATTGSGDFTVALCAEYDALPEIGHGCGHNVIAAASVGAALGLAAVAEELGLTVRLLGTPAEEHGGGKTVMLERGAWEDATVSLMAHPGITDRRTAGVRSRAVERFRVIFTGRAAHSSQSPHLGVNASDAATVSMVSLGLLRQQLESSARVSAFVSLGGQATNVVADRTEVDCEVRAFEIESLRSLKRRVLNCFEAGAVASGCGWEWVRTEPVYANLVQDEGLAQAFDRHLRLLGRDPVDLTDAPAGSTDMGNVSQRVPSIHANLAIEGAGCATHSQAFAEAAVSPAATATITEAAKALAGAVIDVAGDPDLRSDYLARQRGRAVGATCAVFDII